MQFRFDVGEQERHRVGFSFDQVWGPLRITVDGVPVVRRFLVFHLGRTRRYQFAVGDRERHTALIEMRRHLVFGAFRPWTYRIFVDGELVQTEQG
jgi:hypothetical protein